MIIDSFSPVWLGGIISILIFCFIFLVVFWLGSAFVIIKFLFLIWIFSILFFDNFDSFLLSSSKFLIVSILILGALL